MLPPESAEAIVLRRKVVLSFWAVFLFLGLPLWFQTTTIHRTPLPLSVFQSLDDELKGGFGIRSDDGPGIRVAVVVKESCLSDTTTDEISEQVELLVGTEENRSVFSLQLSDGRECRTGCAIPKYSLDCIISDRTPLQKAKISESDEIRVYIPSQVGSKAVIAKGLYDAFVGDILFFNNHHLGSIDHAALPDTGIASTMYRGAPYADAVHLSFTLLISLDTSVSHGEVEVLSPEFQSEWRGHVEELWNTLQSGELSRYLSSITFDTDIGFQYMTDSTQEWARLEEIVSPDKLSSLLDTWDLQSITLLTTNSKSSAPKVLQFVYFLPPHSANTKSSLSFTVANWGGVVMAGDHPDLHAAMRMFARQIDKLLSPVSFSLADGSSKSRKLLPHRHEFARIATIMNLRGVVETLSALSRLVSSLPEMAVPLTVRDLVDGAIKEWHLAVTYLHADIDGVADNLALRHAATAARFARLAVFDKNMMLNMFVPFEHKIAVYLPLLGPVFVPLVAGLRRVIIESRKKKKEKEQ
ncbi:phosphatidylinositol-glycan biosynthesis class S protein [Lipomyces tetrasporus]|uniref:Phosphatidylinositol-glycan biosynthesis class S protein n=1 Tax=Lipomyces tetrasporus TaxID=54092 RepID=A0AAD7QN68_9ASCO|nr:phosphatidylinositol-glycan biosynthesis class S protein [Lipomyces tetrasporus]KAJ8098279.1 phosphatidylinositol-glycan biosynthesis class S protein [Lipomyces tetrasporus]